MRKSWMQEWWWVPCFCITATSVYFHNIQEKKEKLEKLSVKFETLHAQKRFAMQERELLRLQIDSQNDPSWIEMILMRDLGVVPEGWLKVHFSK